MLAHPQKNCPMTVSGHMFLLLLGIVIASSGCSGSRARQVFAPNREFLKLSELRKARTDEDAGGRLVASTETPASKSKRGGLRALARALPWRRDGKIPDDPFLAADERSSNRKGQAVPMFATGSKQASQPARESVPKSPLVDKNVRPPIRKLTPGRSQNNTTLDDFPADLPAETDAMQSAATSPHDRRVEKSDESTRGESDFDRFFQEKMNDSERSDSAAAVEDDVVLSLDMLEEFTQPESVLPDGDPDLLLPLDNHLDRYEESEADTAESILADEVVSDSSYPPAAESGNAFEEPSPESDNLWQAADDVFDWQDSSSDTVSESAALELGTFPETATFEGGLGVDTGNSFGRNQHDADFPEPATSDTAGLRLPPPVTTNLALPAPASETVFFESRFEDDPFLDDFTTQANATMSPRSTSPASGRPILRNFSARTWLLLLSVVVVVYLLIAPERRKPTLPE